MEIELKNLAIGFSAQAILVKDINLSAVNGEIIVVTGDNGVGKTTLLKTIAGLLNPLQGSMTNISVEQIGFSGAEPLKMLSVMTGQEIITFFETINEAVLPVHANEIALYSIIRNKNYQDMSTGMKQVLRVLIATLENKKILLLDEPLKGLAEHASEDIKKYLSKILKGRVIIATAHSPDEWKTIDAKNYLIANERLVLL